MKRLPGILFVFIFALLLPAVASAQATVSGTVRDSSGAVLPGVTVEAASPVLIEKVRTAASDGSGQYRIADLPPGEYTLTFTLSGFNTVKRQGVSVSGTGVIPISIELAVGTLTETLTVTGESPLVDTQTTKRETVISAETIASLPITRNYGGVLYATPGLNVQPGVNANDLMPSMATFSAHGGQSTEGRVFVNGVSVNGPFGSNSVTQFAFDTSNAEEMQVLVSGGLGEAETGGPVANIVPRSGGNTFSGNAFYSGTQSKFQMNNVDDQLKALNIAQAPTVRKNWDSNFALGGPIQRDRLWFYGNMRSVGVAQVVATGMAPNRFAGDATQWVYQAVPGVEVRQVESKIDMSGRLTSQLTRRNRVTFSYTFQDRCQGSALTPNGGGCRQAGSDWIGAPATSETTAPEAGSGYMDQPTTLTQFTYTSPISNRQLIDAALSRFAYGQIGNGSVPPDSTIGMIGVTERSNRYGRANSSYRAPFGWGVYDAVPWNWRASWAYVTGAHSAKLGYQGSLLKYDFTSYTNPALMRYTVDSNLIGSASCAATAVTCPVGLTYATSSYFEFANRAAPHAIFIQDQWTRGRLSLQGALRWDYVKSWMPAFHNGTDETSRFSPAPVRFERTDSVTGYHDITPRVGAAYDLFGNGRTAIKVNAGKYVAAAVADGIYSSMSPALNYVRTINGTRGWTDTNGNFAVDCNLLSSGAQSPTTTGSGDVCAALTGGNLNFGSVVPNTIVDPKVLSGWRVRPYNWNFGVSVQHAILPRLSVEAQYNRRWWGNFLATVNQLVGPGDYDKWTLPVPSNDKLPDGGGGTAQYVSITSAASARGSLSYQTKETDFADARTAYWHGVDVNVTARIAERVNLQAGTSTGRGVRNTCDLWAARPELQGSNRADSCGVTEPWMTSFRGLASYRVPKVDVQVSATLRSTRTTAGGDNASNGTSLNGNYQLPNSEVVKYLGRLPAAALLTGTTTVNIVVPSALYPLERRNQIDVRFAKILRLGGRRLDVGADIYNLLNANTATSFDQTYLFSNSGATYLNPTAIMAPLLVRFNATLTF
jgi:hypothetical protein